MPTHDAALLIVPAGTHVVLAVSAIPAFMARPSHGGYDELAGREAINILTHLHHLPEVLMAQNQVVVAIGWFSVQAVVDFFVGAAKSDAKYLDQHAVRAHLRIGHLAHVNGILFPWKNGDSFHVSR